MSPHQVEGQELGSVLLCMLNALIDVRTNMVLLQAQISKSSQDMESSSSSVVQEPDIMVTIQGIAMPVSQVALHVYTSVLSHHIARVPWFFLEEDEVEKLLYDS